MPNHRRVAVPDDLHERRLRVGDIKVKCHCRLLSVVNVLGFIETHREFLTKKYHILNQYFLQEFLGYQFTTLNTIVIPAPQRESSNRVIFLPFWIPYQGAG